MEVSPAVPFPSAFATFNLVSCRVDREADHAVVFLDDLSRGSPPLLRVQSACLTGTALRARLCDCAAQIDHSLSLIADNRRGMLIYLDEEARGHGLHEKVKGMVEVQNGADTVTAFTNRGLPADPRTYEAVGPILRALNVMPTVRLITNNPAKARALEAQGFRVVERVPVEVEPTDLTRRYLETKKHKLGHVISTVD